MFHPSPHKFSRVGDIVGDLMRKVNVSYTDIFLSIPLIGYLGLIILNLQFFMIHYLSLQSQFLNHICPPLFLCFSSCVSFFTYPPLLSLPLYFISFRLFFSFIIISNPINYIILIFATLIFYHNFPSLCSKI